LKKFPRLIFIAFLLNLASCISPDNHGDDPKTVLSSFFDAIAAKNFDKAKQLTTQDSEGMLQMAQAAMERTPDSIQQSSFGKKNLYLGDPVINAGYATIAVKSVHVPDSIYFSLHREENKWLVSLNISTLYQLNRQALDGGALPILSDSLKNLNRATVRDTAAISKDGMKDAHKKMDSINTRLKKAP
jgi:hypothetical protein